MIKYLLKKWTLEFKIVLKRAGLIIFKNYFPPKKEPIDKYIHLKNKELITYLN